MRKPKHTPIRTCVACRTADEKRDLLRVARTADGVVFDPKGKVSGRGAYVCASLTCIAQARKQKRLERALNVPSVSGELFDALAARAELTSSSEAGTPHAVNVVVETPAESQNPQSQA